MTWLSDHYEVAFGALALLAAFLVGFQIRAILRRRGVRRALSEARALAEQGRGEDALNLLLDAERAWAFNIHNGTPNSFLSDLDALEGIVSGALALLSADGRETIAPFFEAVFAGMRDVLSDRRSFSAVDGRTPVGDAADRWSALEARLFFLRGVFREFAEDRDLSGLEALHEDPFAAAGPSGEAVLSPASGPSDGTQGPAAVPSETPGVPSAADLRLPPAKITAGILVILIAVFGFFFSVKSSPFRQKMLDLLAPNGFEVWTGAWWGLLTSAFVHIEIWHVLFNAWWAWDFGKILEPSMGKRGFVTLVLCAAVASSGAELAIFSHTGIGFSGVVYAFFGYSLAARRVHPALDRILTPGTILLLLGWLVLCVVLTHTGALNVGNAAHAGGLAFGFCAGNVFSARRLCAVNSACLAALLALAVLSTIYLPWSKAWTTRGFYAAVREARTKAAAGDPEAQVLHGSVLVKMGRTEDGLVWLRKAAESGRPEALNALAWVLATAGEDRLRRGDEAVSIARRACERNGWKKAAYLDTLAAAYAEIDDWDAAVQMQERALSLLPAEPPGPESGDPNDYRVRLDRYRRKEKTRE